MTVHEAIELLRVDAYQRGMSDLVAVYGWSAMRLRMLELRRIVGNSNQPGEN